MPMLSLIADPAAYRPCIQNLLTDGETVRAYWLRLFETHVETLARLPVGADRLAAITLQCCDAARDSDLLILEGMGRAVESNYDARFTVDTLKFALIKDVMVAGLLVVDLFAPIFRFEPTTCSTAAFL